MSVAWAGILLPVCILLHSQWPELLCVVCLNQNPRTEKLREYFTRYGEVVDCVVMKNPETGRSRGFGFISFKDASRVEAVLNSGPHLLDGRTVSWSIVRLRTSHSLYSSCASFLASQKIDPKSCNTKGAQKGKREVRLMNYPKVFLGGLPPDVNETLLRNFFSKYGKVVEVVIMYNQEKKSLRGNGFRGETSLFQFSSSFSHAPQTFETLTYYTCFCDNTRTIHPFWHDWHSESEKTENESRSRQEYMEILFLSIVSHVSIDREQHAAFSFSFCTISDCMLSITINNTNIMQYLFVMSPNTDYWFSGFGFLSFESEDSVNTVTAEHFVTINGKKVEFRIPIISCY